MTYTLLRNPSIVYTRKVFNQSRMSRALAERGVVVGRGQDGMESVVLDSVAI